MDYEDHLYRVERFDAYRSAMLGMGIQCDPGPVPIDRMRMRVFEQMAGPLAFQHFRGDLMHVQRTRALMRRSDWADNIWVYRERGTGANFDMNGVEIRTRRGDVILCESDAVWRTMGIDGYDINMWALPLAMVRPHLPAIPRPIGLLIPARSAMGPVLTAYLDALSGQLGQLDAVEAALLADNLGRLMAVACGANSGGHGDALRSAKVEQARRHIDRHLTEELRPEQVAAVLGISLRQLHLVFEPTGESFSQYVRRRRLHECRATLENPLASGRSVADIAFAWGFPSLPSFYRAFGNAFGVAPGDIRPPRG